jgi:hypothetical protein
MLSRLSGLIFQGLLHTSSKFARVLLTLVTMVGCVYTRVLRLQPGHKFCLLGRLSTEVGWHHYDTIKVYIYFHSLVICVEVTQRVLLRNLGS